MSKDGKKKTSFIKTVKRICGFVADVVKVGFGYIARKTKEYAKKKLRGRTFMQALRDLFGSIADSFKALPIALKGVIAGSLLLLIVVIVIRVCTPTKFPEGTIIGSVDVSGMTAASARDAVESVYNGYELTLVEKNGKAESINGGEISLKVTLSDSFDDLPKAEDPAGEAAGIINVEFDEAKLDSRISELDCVNNTSGQKPVDAELVYEGSKFVIRPSATGDTVDTAVLKNKIISSIKSGAKLLDLEAEGVYEMPSVSSDDPELLNRQKELNELTVMTITLKFGENTETITPETVAGWYGANSELDDSKISEYVKALAQKYNTKDLDKSFTTHYGETIVLSNSCYGWELDNEYAVEQLKAIVNERQSVTLDLTDRSDESDKWWMSVAAAYSDTGYYGSTYAEVSIASQYMWMYRDGEVVFESEVVTGQPDSEHDTPVGIYKILYMEENATLRGEDYETEVQYWMVFTDDIGFHDADWQWAFGEGMNEINGSHGCVNLPVDAAGDLYDLVYVGMPVFVY